MYRVMLVDDYEIFRRQLKQQACWNKQSRFTISGEADNGWDALRALRETPVDILITDIKMPKLNGLDLLEQVKKDDLCKCVILLSEYADFEYARRGIVLGAFDYIVKPIRDNSFCVVLERAADYLSKTTKTEDLTLYEREAVVNCILESSAHFESAVVGVASKCELVVNHDFVKYGVIMAENERKIYNAIVEKREWLSYLVTDIDIICEKIIRADSTYTVTAIFEEFLREIYTDVRTYYPPGMSPLSLKVVNYILQHLFDRQTLSSTAENCFVSKAYLSHSFKLDMGVSFVEYVGSIKMQIIKKLLVETEMSVSEIAEKLHYEDSKYMSRLFKNVFGMPPSDYKKSHLRMQPSS